jgi:hypothetical protein
VSRVAAAAKAKRISHTVCARGSHTKTTKVEHAYVCKLSAHLSSFERLISRQLRKPPTLARSSLPIFVVSSQPGDTATISNRRSVQPLPPTTSAANRRTVPLRRAQSRTTNNSRRPAAAQASGGGIPLRTTSTRLQRSRRKLLVINLCPSPPSVIHRHSLS